jgi:cyclophilin family peptidyl-prolyl cis-trans isomerase
MHPFRRHTLISTFATLATLAALGTGAALLAGPARAQAGTGAAAPVIVTLDTTAGPIVLELDAQHAPRTVANFVRYVKEGFYSGTIFHRVIPGFMIQGGGFTPDMQQKQTHEPIAIESDNTLKNVRGSIAMARTANPNSATAQFFINVADNGMLDYPGSDGAGYTVFGKVIDGTAAVEAIRTSPTTRKGMFADVPVNAPVIRKATLGR